MEIEGYIRSEDAKLRIDIYTPKPVPKEYLELLGFSPGIELSRLELTKKFYQYIHDNKLVSPDRHTIIPNSPLRNALMIKEGNELTFNNFQKFLNVRYKINNFHA